jgi:ATPase family AAA domain-containing protein 3A/B
MYTEARLGKPSLVRETTKKNFLQMAKSPISSVKFLFGTGKGEAALNEIVLEASVHQYSQHEEK